MLERGEMARGNEALFGKLLPFLSKVPVPDVAKVRQGGAPALRCWGAVSAAKGEGARPCLEGSFRS